VSGCLPDSAARCVRLPAGQPAVCPAAGRTACGVSGCLPDSAAPCARVVVASRWWS